MDALKARYERVRAINRARGCDPTTQHFEALAARTAAVVNTDLAVTYSLFTQDDALYAPYHKLVEAGIRAPAELTNARHRGAVGQLLYGDHSREIVYAALSANGRGLTTYGGRGGGAQLELRESAIDFRASVLDSNSYTFVEQNDVRPGGEFPHGHLACWSERHRLAVSKVGGSLEPDVDHHEMQRLLLASNGDRGTDSFMEVHIYGTFSGASIARVTLPPIPEKAEPGSVDDVNAVTAQFLHSLLNRISIPCTF